VRLLHVVPTYLPATRYGGPIYSVHHLCRSLVALGHEVHVFTTTVDGEGDSEVPLDRPVELDGVRVWYFRSPFARRLYWSPGMRRRMLEMAAGFDLIHCHSVFLWPTTLACRMARRFRVPHVIAPRGMLIKELIDRRGALRKRGWIRLFETRNLAGASAIHFTADGEQQELDRLGYHYRKAVVVPNGVELPQPFSEADIAADVREAMGEGDYLLFLSRISWKKGIERLIDAMPRLPGRHALIVGNDEEGLLPLLQARVREHGLGDRVRFLPRTVGGADKEALFKGAALFVLPSLSENFGNVVLEAMIRRCPVVVTREVGAGGVVREADAGLVVAGDPGALAEGINEMLAMSDLAEIGNRGAAFVAARYGWDKVAGQMEAAYEEIVAAAKWEKAR